MSTIQFMVEGEEGEEETFTLPAKKEVCSRCDGEGKHVNPNVDGQGISPEEFQEDPDFAEDYFSGVYDMTCEECHGLRVVDVVDREHADKVTLALYDQQEEQKYQAARERESEIRYGY